MTEHFQSYTPNVRGMTADDLGIGVTAQATSTHASSAPDSPSIRSDDPAVLRAVRLSTEFGGVIFTGPPGTSKTFIAAQVGELLAESDPQRIWFVQFHASYQYEDFMYGFVPKEDASGFTPRLGPFLTACERAAADPQHKYVSVIDELSRADVGRVFGEALTYIERSKRELEFTIASGRSYSVPSNLVILATMNPQDRGVDEVDAAFERRFAKIAMDPSPDILGTILDDNGVAVPLRDNIVHWFRRINRLALKNSAASVGHAYFVNVTDEETLRELWDYQLQFLVRRAFRNDEQAGGEIHAAWERLFVQQEQSVFEAATPQDPGAPVASPPPEAPAPPTVGA